MQDGEDGAGGHVVPDSLQLLRSRLDTLVLHQLDPATHLRIKDNIAEGSFGTVHTAEATVPAYGQPAGTAEPRLVAVKYMSTSAGDTDRSGLYSSLKQTIVVLKCSAVDSVLF